MGNVLKQNMYSIKTFDSEMKYVHCSSLKLYTRKYGNYIAGVLYLVYSKYFCDFMTLKAKQGLDKTSSLNWVYGDTARSNNSQKSLMQVM